MITRIIHNNHQSPRNTDKGVKKQQAVEMIVDVKSDILPPNTSLNIPPGIWNKTYPM